MTNEEIKYGRECLAFREESNEELRKQGYGFCSIRNTIIRPGVTPCIEDCILVSNYYKRLNSSKIEKGVD